MRSKLAKLLENKKKTGMYRIEAKEDLAEVTAKAEALGWMVFQMDGGDLPDKSAFLSRSATVMRFPAYFGQNWDAFEETINDLSWAPAAGYVLLYDRVANFAVNRPAEWAIALDILRAAAAEWARRGVPFTVLLRQDGGAARGVPRLT